jgi:hypothetical protein
MQGAIAEGKGENDFTGVARVERLVWAMPGAMNHGLHYRYTIRTDQTLYRHT